MKQLEGRTAIITGGNQGLGKAIAAAYVKAGASVVICARDEALLKATAKELESHTGNNQAITWVKADVSREEDVERLVSIALERHSTIEVLVNNAGIYGPKGLLEDVDWQEWKRAIEINLYGPLLMVRALIKHFRKHHYGKIINLSGGGATAPLPRLSSYAASKAAIVRLTETIAHETLGCGIDVNAIAPGALNTRLLNEIIEAGPEAVGETFYQRSIKQRDDGGAPMEKAADLCVYLASSESDGITGRLLSAVWDPWAELKRHKDELAKSEIYTLRRIVPADRGQSWG